MRCLLIGCGDAGSKLVESLMEIQQRSCNNETERRYFEAVIFNTADTDIEKIKKIDHNSKMLIGAGTTIAGGHGAGGEPRIGAQAASNDYWKITSKIEEKMAEINRNPLMEGDIDAFLIFAGLGGGSGSGMAPVIATLLKENYFEEQYPTIGVLVLPSETEGDLYSYNAYTVLQSILNESNFDGIILSYLGGKFLNYSLSTSEFYKNFDLEVSKVLYMLMATGIGGSKTIDSSDILNTMKEGGGICTIGHVSANINAKGEIEDFIEEKIAEDSGKTVSPSLEGWDARITKKLVARSVNLNNLLCPLDFTKSKSALILFKPDKDYSLSRVAQEEALQWLQSRIDGVVRIGDIGIENFKIKLNSDRTEDKEIEQNTTIEVITLLAGISDVSLLKRMEARAKRVKKIAQPPVGKRLLINVFGTHEMDNTMLIPCSEYRKREIVQVQEKIFESAMDMYANELRKVIITASSKKIGGRITVETIKPIPDPNSICWSELKTAKVSNLTPNCFETLLIYFDETDGTYLRRKYTLRAEKEEIKDKEIGKKVKIRDIEILRIKNNWTNPEKYAVDEILDKIKSYWKECTEAYIAGIRKYPNCSRFFPDSQCYEVKVVNLGAINKIKKADETFEEEFIHEIQESLSKGKCSGMHTEYLRYYYYINTVPRPTVLTCEQMKNIIFSEHSDEYRDSGFGSCDRSDEGIHKDKIDRIKDHDLDDSEKIRMPDFGESDDNSSEEED